MTQPAPITLVLGPEELLVDRAVSKVVRAVRAADADAEVRELEATDAAPGDIGALTAPSLFGDRKVLVVRELAQAGNDLFGELTAYVAAPAEEVTLVLVHKGGVRGKQLLAAARAAGAAEVDCAEVKTRADKLRFVKGELRAARRRFDDDAVEALLDAVGGDLRALASACAQLVADTSETLRIDVVERYYEGRADVTGFVVADRTVEGRPAEALTQLRWALGAGVDPVLIVSALATALRSLVRVGAAPRGLRSADVAREAGLPPWKVDVVRRQLRGWDGDGVGRAIVAVAAADAAIKGSGGDPLYALERAVLVVAACRTG